ncbi:MAG TPA: hypothetical protein VHB77_01780, partial [Planctomycetaceae bacterium]|nr:hypothetical protein [Planctomycetaceae bacterium]
DGVIQTKSLAMQRAMRILVFDQDFAPPESDPDWQPRWTGDPAWESRGKGFVVDTRFDHESGGKPAWLNYRHWIRSGGDHVTQVKAPPPPGSADLTGISGMPLWYDADHRTLCCRGALTTAERDDLLTKCTDGAFRDAVERLYAESHIAPITDTYGYNRSGPGGGGGQVVRDLALSLTLGYEAGQGDFRVEMTDGAQRFACVLDFSHSELRLERDEDAEPLRKTTLLVPAVEHPLRLEFAWMDHQLLVAVDGRLAFEPWDDPSPTVPDEAPLLPVRLGANGLKLYAANLRLYRDIYYTEPEGQPTDAGWTLADEPGRREYFMLGDNSPVSVDSRFWPRSKSVTDASWLGKPFLVHLPARTRPVRIGGHEAQIRIPDPARIRYIR